MSLPMIAVKAALLLTLAVFAAFGAYILDCYRSVEALQSRDFRLLQLSGVVTHLDEVLTMSARMATATGNLKWEERYRSFEPQLDLAIHEIIRLAPEVQELEGATQTELANRRLVEMENQAFDLVRTGSREDARSLLLSEDYEHQKAVYKEGLEKAVATLWARGEATLSTHIRRTTWAVAMGVVALPILIASWLRAMQMIRQHLSERSRTEAELRRSHVALEHRVAERTEDLTAANVRLKAEITQRERIDAELRESSAALAHMLEEQFALLQYTRDFVYRHDAKGVFNYMSPAVEQITGYTVAEWCKHYTTYMTQNPINQKVIEYTEETLRTGRESPPYLVEILHKDGRPVMLEVSERPYLENGRVSGIVGVARDVTERHQAEAAHRQSEERLQAILDNSPAVIYMKDPHGRYLLINCRYEELFHITRSQILGKTDYDMFPRETADAFLANDRRVLEARTAIEFEEVAPQDDGLHTYISLKFPLWDVAGNPYAVCGISTDITERKRAAEELTRAKETAEAANRAKGVFLANMSHEIRTPITAMLGAAELLDSDARTTGPEPEHVDMILRNGRHLLALVDDLLDLSRAEAGKLDVQRVPASLVEIMTDVQAVAAPLHRRPNVEFRIIYDTDIPAGIQTDPTRLKQALINLVINALKFTRRGHVWIRVSVASSIAEPRLAIAVEDTGIGVPPGESDRIFQVFTQVTSPMGGVAEGVGLGLPLARSIAERLGGSVELTRGEEQGSTFTLRTATGPLDRITWIRPQDIQIPPHTPSRRAENRLQGNILLADDFTDTCRLIAEALTRQGAVVTTVADGESAVEVASQQAFDLILMDIRMPRKDGIAATRELRDRGCLTPIIALTASTTESDRQGILRAGFDDLWLKPLTLEHLVTEVASYLGGPPEHSSLPVRPAAPSDESKSSHSRLEAVRVEFVRNLPQRVAQIVASVQTQDLRCAREQLHQLVGSGGLYGFMPISVEAARLLPLAREGTLCADHDGLRTLEKLAQEATESLCDLPPVHSQPG